MCLVSVILVTYNSSAFLAETIDSILSQTFEDFELIIIDDHSTDNTLEILKSYNDPRLFYFSGKHNRIENLNKAVALANGKYIARIDHDDIMLPDRLKKQYDFMEYHSEIIVCGSWMYTFGNEERLIPCLGSHKEISSAMILGNPMANPTTFMRKKILDKNKILYRNGFSFAEDYRMWAELILLGRFANLEEVLVKYRISKKQASNMNMQEIIDASIKIRLWLIDEYYSRLKSEVNSFRLKQFERLRCAFLRDELSEEKYFKESYEFFRGVILKGLINFNY